MKRKLLYLFGLILLATGLFAGCMVSLDSPEGTVPGTGQEKDAGNIDEAEKADKADETDKNEKDDGKDEANETGNADKAETIADSESTQNTEDTSNTETSQEETENKNNQGDIEETGEYTSKEEVAEYLYRFGHLPDNFITKKEAKSLGWVSKEGNLGEVAPGKSIGGDYFGNYEGNLPEKKGRSYYECDIDSDGGYRGSKRIVYSNDGLIYYTEDHYENFELLYGEE